MVATLLLLWACTPEDPTRPTPPGPAPELTVVDRAIDAGVQDHALGLFKKGRGCSLADLDGDGLLDLILANPGDPSYWLHNASMPGAPSFEVRDVLDPDGLMWGATAADWDHDGDLDIAATYGGLDGRGANRLLRSDPGPVFTDVAPELGLDMLRDPSGALEPRATIASTWLDFDNDGDLDLFHDEHIHPWGLANTDLSGTNLGWNSLWRNEGDGTFTNAIDEVGLAHHATTQFSTWLDFDNDGDLDLFENAYRWGGGVNRFWRNDGGAFTEVTDELTPAGGDLHYPVNSFVSATADFNQDGWLDLLVFVRGLPLAGPHLDGHLLWINLEGQGFVELAGPALLNNPFDPAIGGGHRDHTTNGVMGASVEDLDLDGIPDVFIGNGGPSGGWRNQLFLSTGLDTVDVDGFGPIAIPVFANRSALIDTPVEEEAGAPPYPPHPYRTHAGCVADLDGDGSRELYVTNGGMNGVGGDRVREPNRLFSFVVNPMPRWLEIEVRGDGVRANVHGIGARIAITVEENGAQRTVHDVVLSRNGFSAQHGYIRQIGLGSADRVVEVVVDGPGDARAVVEAPALDSRVEVWL